MPRAPKKCADSNCEERVIGLRYCPAHAARWERRPTSRTTSPEHRAWRAAVLNRDHWRCRIRGAHCIGKATEADHIVEDADGGGLQLSNGQAACKPCHAEKTAAHANATRWGNSKHSSHLGNAKG